MPSESRTPETGAPCSRQRTCLTLWQGRRTWDLRRNFPSPLYIRSMYIGTCGRGIEFQRARRRRTVKFPFLLVAHITREREIWGGISFASLYKRSMKMLSEQSCEHSINWTMDQSIPFMRVVVEHKVRSRLNERTSDSVHRKGIFPVSRDSGLAVSVKFLTHLLVIPIVPRNALTWDWLTGLAT